MNKTYYDILGLEKTATADEIRKAFRKLAAENHPDKGGSDVRFKEINHAHQVLSDPAKRRNYDTFGHEDGLTGMPRHAHNPRAGSTTPLDDLFSNFNFHVNVDPFAGFGGFGRRASQSANARPAPTPGETVHAQVTITVEESLCGAKKPLKVSQGLLVPCRACNETGKAKTERCLACSGGGRVADFFSKGNPWRNCRKCDGTGSVSEKCTTCKGTGREEAMREITFSIPKGIRTGQSVKLRGLGKPGSPAGDLIVTFSLEDTAGWRVRGDRLYTCVAVDLGLLLSGGTAHVEVPGGTKAEIRVPPGGGEAVAFGAWKNPGGADGDVVVTFKLRVENLTPRAERLIRELGDELSPQARRV